MVYGSSHFWIDSNFPGAGDLLLFLRMCPQNSTSLMNIFALQWSTISVSRTLLTSFWWLTRTSYHDFPVDPIMMSSTYGSALSISRKTHSSIFWNMAFPFLAPLLAPSIDTNPLELTYRWYVVFPLSVAFNDTHPSGVIHSKFCNSLVFVKCPQFGGGVAHRRWLHRWNDGNFRPSDSHWVFLGYGKRGATPGTYFLLDFFISDYFIRKFDPGCPPLPLNLEHSLFEWYGTRF